MSFGWSSADGVQPRVMRLLDALAAAIVFLKWFDAYANVPNPS
jgi:hypothetical protein